MTHSQRHLHDRLPPLMMRSHRATLAQKIARKSMETVAVCAAASCVIITSVTLTRTRGQVGGFKRTVFNTNEHRKKRTSLVWVRHKVGGGTQREVVKAGAEWMSRRRLFGGELGEVQAGYVTRMGAGSGTSGTTTKPQRETEIYDVLG